MITDHDRSGWFGASDVQYIVGNWDTKTFESWWRVKQGFEANDFTNDAMLAGTYYEHRILESIGLPMTYDRQVLIPALRLRVNLDAESGETIYECKTYRWERGFKMPKKYLQQVWVQMYATGFREGYIVTYGLEEEDYRNYYRDIDQTRMRLIPVEYDEEWVNETFLPRLTCLAMCLTEGRFPKQDFG